jgi:hypothetical protein
MPGVRGMKPVALISMRMLFSDSAAYFCCLQVVGFVHSRVCVCIYIYIVAH